MFSSIKYCKILLINHLYLDPEKEKISWNDKNKIIVILSVPQSILKVLVSSGNFSNIWAHILPQSAFLGACDIITSWKMHIFIAIYYPMSRLFLSIAIIANILTSDCIYHSRTFRSMLLVPCILAKGINYSIPILMILLLSYHLQGKYNYSHLLKKECLHICFKQIVITTKTKTINQKQSKTK